MGRLNVSGETMQDHGGTRGHNSLSQLPSSPDPARLTPVSYTGPARAPCSSAWGSFGSPGWKMIKVLQGSARFILGVSNKECSSRSHEPAASIWDC